MLTEQEVIVLLNEKIAKNEVKPSTSRYLAKIKVLKSFLIKQQTELAALQNELDRVEIDIQRSKGAVSVLLELAAEDEEMLKPTETNK